jgi:hypothetical protein
MLGEQLKVLSELELDSTLRQLALRFLRSTSSSMASTQCPRPILMIACQRSRKRQSPSPAIYGS